MQIPPRRENAAAIKLAIVLAIALVLAGLAKCGWVPWVG
jgi:hypothetical protein